MSLVLTNSAVFIQANLECCLFYSGILSKQYFFFWKITLISGGPSSLKGNGQLGMCT